MKQRFWEIDFLRGTSILLVILIHCTVYFFSNPVAQFLWNISQLSVPVFIFCSLYIFVAKELPKDEPFLAYLYKRIKRLLIPYFVFVPFFLILLTILNQKIPSSKYIVQSLTLTGGIDINWLILLYIQLTLMLAVIKALKHKTFALITLSLTATLTSIFFMYYQLPASLSYKYVMWLPWSVMLGFTYLFVRLQEKRSYLALLGIVSLVVFLVLLFILQSVDHSLIFRENKYPPNLYYLSFGILSIIVLYFLSTLFTRIAKPVTYLSNNSYQLYFIHYFFLIWLASNKQFLALPWWIFFLIILGISLMTLIVWDLLLRWFKKIRS